MVHGAAWGALEGCMGGTTGVHGGGHMCKSNARHMHNCNLRHSDSLCLSWYVMGTFPLQARSVSLCLSTPLHPPLTLRSSGCL